MSQARSQPSDASPPDLSVLVPCDDEAEALETVRALAAQTAPGVLEVIVGRAWPRCSGPPAAAAPGVRVLDVAAASPTAALNACLASARGELVLVLAGGDVPLGDDLLAGHRAAHRECAGALVGDVRPGEGSATRRPVWEAPWPPLAPAPPVRHFSAPRAALLAAGGLDERLPDLEVAVLDLLVRLNEGGVGWREQRDLAVRPAQRNIRAVRTAWLDRGRAAEALPELALARGTPMVPRGRRRTRVALRWAEPALRALAARGGSDADAVRRLAARAAFVRGRVRSPLSLEPLARGGPAADPAVAPQRPAVAVVVPFSGDAGAAERLLGHLMRVRRRAGDDMLVVDNSPRAVVTARDGIRMLRAEREQSSYYAREVGWRATSAPWVAYIDADCIPAPGLLDAFFNPGPSPGTGAVAGAVLDPPAPGSWAARWAAEVSTMSQSRLLSRASWPFALTANVLVERRALELVGGFATGIRSGGDADLCRRLAQAGCGIEYRPRAAVVHDHRDSLGALLAQFARYGRGIAWRDRRAPEVGLLDGPPNMWELAALALEVPLDLLAARFDRAAAHAGDVLTLLAMRAGALAGNRPAASPPAPAVVGIARSWPADGAAPKHVRRVEALGRGPRPAPDRVRAVFVEDDAPLDLLAALCWLGVGRRAGRYRALRALSDSRRRRALVTRAPVARRVASARELVALDADPWTAETLDALAVLLAR
jgi:GT2 family glycosyltransferase